MSRIGKISVSVPKNVKVAFSSTAVSVEGPKGKLALNLPHGIKLEQKEDKIFVNRLRNLKQDRANHGTIRAILVNMVAGVSDGHKRNLEIQGVGFKAQLQGSKLILNLGFSHPIDFEIPKDVKVSLAKPTEISIEGVDKALVGQVAAQIRGLKPPEPYKGKGVRYAGEVVKRKQGKSVTK